MATEPSQAAIDMIVSFEVTSKAVYEQKYQRPIWPGGQSGVTVGIGYDVGYVKAAKLTADWQGKLPAAMIAELKHAVGVKGAPARLLAIELAPRVVVPWEPAMAVFATVDLPNYSRDVRNGLANTAELSEDSFGALASLVYNRGASFQKAGDRYREMRAIRAHMAARQFSAVTQDILDMQRLWPNVPGLQRRRRQEAALFKQGLAALTGAGAGQDERRLG